MSDRIVTILLVEDDDVDAEAIVRAFRKNRIANPVIRARDGLEALALLRESSPASRLTQPCIILLDLNMPRMDGKEFLAELRRDPQLSSYIVFALTTSNDAMDKLAAYVKNIAGYLLKSQVGDEFVRLTTMLEGFWHAIQFPPDVPRLPAEAQLLAGGRV